MPQTEEWNLIDWRENDGSMGRWRERFTPEAAKQLGSAIEYQVLRDEWADDTPDGVPERLILEVRPNPH